MNFCCDAPESCETTENELAAVGCGYCTDDTPQYFKIEIEDATGDMTNAEGTFILPNDAINANSPNDCLWLTSTVPLVDLSVNPISTNMRLWIGGGETNNARLLLEQNNIPFGTDVIFDLNPDSSLGALCFNFNREQFTYSGAYGSANIYLTAICKTSELGSDECVSTCAPSTTPNFLLLTLTGFGGPYSFLNGTHVMGPYQTGIRGCQASKIFDGTDRVDNCWYPGSAFPIYRIYIHTSISDVTRNWNIPRDQHRYVAWVEIAVMLINNAFFTLAHFEKLDGLRGRFGEFPPPNCTQQVGSLVLCKNISGPPHMRIGCPPVCPDAPDPTATLGLL